MTGSRNLYCSNMFGNVGSGCFSFFYKNGQSNFKILSNDPNKSQRGFALLSAVLVTMFLGIVIGAAFMGMNMQLKESDQRIYSQDAFYTAEAGLENAVYQLRRDLNWRPNPSFTGTVYRNPNDLTTVIGNYTVRVADPSVIDQAANVFGFPYVMVRSDGVDVRNLSKRSILARVVLVSPTNFLAFTLGDLTIRSGAKFDNDILARDIAFDIDTSKTGSDREIEVNGDVNYMRSVKGQNSPDVKINGGKVQASPSVTFTGVDIPRYQNLTTVGQDQHNGSYTVNGTINKNTQTSSQGVVFVDGDLHIQGTYDENMVFVATGNIYIDGDLKASTSGGKTPQLGLFSKNDVIISATANSNIQIEAFVLADGGQFKAEYGNTPKTELKFNGAISVRGKDGVPGIDLNAYAKREYKYNPNFTASTIPFLPSIANSVTWSEINPNDVFPPP